jgi:hypothetical protein
MLPSFFFSSTVYLEPAATFTNSADEAADSASVVDILASNTPVELARLNQALDQICRPG